jgi:hypothetical protein
MAKGDGVATKTKSTQSPKAASSCDLTSSYPTASIVTCIKYLAEAACGDNEWQANRARRFSGSKTTRPMVAMPWTNVNRERNVVTKCVKSFNGGLNVICCRNSLGAEMFNLNARLCQFHDLPEWLCIVLGGLL